jgi:hypothetical protein
VQRVYEAASRSASLQPFVPALIRAEAARGADARSVLTIADATHGFDARTCSVIDIKLGTRSFVEDVRSEYEPQYAAKFAEYGVAAPRERCTKRAYMEWRDASTTTATLGFRVTGMAVARRAGDSSSSDDAASTATRRVSVPRGERGLQWAQDVGLARSADLALLFFLHDGTGLRRDVADALLEQLRGFRDAAASSAFVAAHEIIGSSLLCVYDATGRVAVRWIDFSHAYAPRVTASGEVAPVGAVGDKKDGVLHGVDALIAVVQRIRNGDVAACELDAVPVDVL